MMNRVLCVFLLVLAASSAADPDIRELYARARLLAEQNQNLAEAVRLYGQVVQLARGQHALAARAQYEQGRLYERLGRKAEAQRAYGAVVRGYPDQPAVVALARAKLPPGTPGTDVSIRRIWAGEDVDAFGRVSPDGRLLSFTDWKNGGDLAVRDIETGEKRRVTRHANAGGASPSSAMWSLFSPDARRLAYSWYENDWPEIRVINVGGAAMRKLYRAERKNHFLKVADWSPDAKNILVVLEQRQPYPEFLLIDVAGGSMRSIPAAGRAHETRALFSPDGKYIVYDAEVGRDPVNLDIRIIELSSLRDAPLVEHPAMDYLLGWSPDGSVLFLSDRSGALGIWAVPVAEGAPGETPRLLKPDTGRLDPNGITRRGALYYNISASANDVYVAEIDPATALVVSPPAPLSQRYVGSKITPAWSPDGSSIVYLSVRGARGAAALVVRSLADGKEREIYPGMARVVRVLTWRRDGRSVFVQGNGLDGAWGIYRVDLETAKATLTGPSGVDRPAFSSDASTIYLMQGQQDLVERSLHTGETRVIYHTDVPYALKNPNTDLSPDGRMLVFQLMNVPDDRHDSLAVLPINGGDPRILLTIEHPEQFMGNTLIWTPDSRQILMARGRDGRSTLWKISADGGPAQEIGLSMPGLIRMMRLHPDGRRLAFMNGEGKDEIWALDNLLPSASPARAAQRK
jgi:Tol biopolymer transport system component